MGPRSHAGTSLWSLSRERPERALVLAFGSALLAALGAGCATPSPTDPTTGVVIEVRRGPIAPVDRVGVDNTAPVGDAAVVLIDPSGNQVASATTDTSGRVTVLAFPGSYQIAIRTCPGSIRLAQPAPVVVAQGSLASTRLVCDTGIR
jgi:hypothetical protein